MPTQSSRYWDDVKKNAKRFGALPPQLLVVLSLEFFNSFRGFGMRFVIYNYVTNEFHLSDTQTGTILGVKGLLDCLFGLCGSILVDLVGVRQTSIAALGVAIVGRSLLAFGRSRTALYAAVFFFSPIGESLLGTGLYRVALKKLTTPKTRPFAFAISYAISNLSGALGDVLVDQMRKRPDTTIGGMVFTPTRKFVILTLGAVVAAFFIALLLLKDQTVSDPDDPEDDVVVPPDAVDGKPMLPCFEGRGFKVFDTKPASEEIAEKIRSVPRQDSNEYSGADESAKKEPSILTSLWEGVRWTLRQSKELLFLRNTWRMLVFGFASFAVGMQWAAMEIVMPPFLERFYGEGVPIYTVQSINLWGCLFLPPIVGCLSATFEDFRVIMPGMWVMALSPLAVITWPTVAGASLWQVWMTLGEVFWSPRVVAWTASLAPTGKEGLFFAIGSARALLGPVADFFLGRLNAEYNPNCPDCRDSYGHFCDQSVVDGDEDLNGLFGCSSEEEVCGKLTVSSESQCPSMCQDCPGWESNAHLLWSLLLLLSLTSPVLVWLFLPFFRGHHGFSEGLYGVFRCSLKRLFGICGAEDEASLNRRRKSYNKVEVDSSVLRKGSATVEEDYGFENCGDVGLSDTEGVATLSRRRISYDQILGGMPVKGKGRANAPEENDLYDDSDENGMEMVLV